jgi:hypothetical protein
MPNTCAALLNASRSRFRRGIAGAATLDAVPSTLGSRSDTRQSPTVMCRCGSRPTVEAERPCTETERVQAERFMVSGPVRL